MTKADAKDAGKEVNGVGGGKQQHGEQEATSCSEQISPAFHLAEQQAPGGCSMLQENISYSVIHPDC
jgi:hypothetical protein